MTTQNSANNRNAEQQPRGSRLQEAHPVRRTGLEGHEVASGQRMLRLGYTTGSCAAAAAKAATAMLLSGEEIEEIALQTPGGILLHLLIEDVHWARGDNGRMAAVSCAVRKDGGDDIDQTHGALIYAEVRLAAEAQARGVTVHIDGGAGVGRVTRPGLDQPVGAAAINHVPRDMIRENVQEVCEKAGFSGEVWVVISVPRGEEIAAKTFNPRLGIVGGISILGTSGIVFPMSERALLDAIEAEMRMHAAGGASVLVLTPGNYGEAFAAQAPELRGAPDMKCSNFVGETIDMAVRLGIRGLLFVAHVGKFVKVSGGIMNTHSRAADCRAELLAAAALRAGAEAALCRRLLDTGTTEEALAVLREAGEELFAGAMAQMTARIDFHLRRRAAGQLTIGAIVFSNTYGELGRTEAVGQLLGMLRKGGA